MSFTGSIVVTDESDNIGSPFAQAGLATQPLLDRPARHAA
jgi:hypothetical protein